jgi:hypothetical protein
LGLKAAAANGGCSLLALKGLVFPPEFSRTKADKRDEKPGDLTSTLIGVGSCKDLRLRLGESEFVLDKALLFGEYIFFSSEFNFSAKNFCLKSEFLNVYPSSCRRVCVCVTALLKVCSATEPFFLVLLFLIWPIFSLKNLVISIFLS